jgi:hypothetical protein
VINNGRVLGQNGDAALALQIVGVHHAIDHSFIGAEGAALAQHGVHQRGFSVINVRDNCDIANAGIQIGLLASLLSKEWISFYSIWISALMRAIKVGMKRKNGRRRSLETQAVRIRRSAVFNVRAAG